jgi:hypothetical protein
VTIIRLPLAISSADLLGGTLLRIERIKKRSLTFQMPSVYVRFEVFTAVTMKNGVFWNVTPCGSCKNRRFGGTWRLLHQGDKNR